MANTRVYYGVYDGQVCDIEDPEKRGRIRCVIPEVTGDSPSAWCEPCIPVAFDDNGDFFIPRLQEFVWIMFEQGNPNNPVYFGGWWSENRTPIAKDYDRKTNERIISFFNSFIKMLKSEKRIELGVTENDPEIVIEEGEVTIKGVEGKVKDVKVNNVSVLNNDGVAYVVVPVKTSDLNNDSGFISDNNYIHTDNNYSNAEKLKLAGVEENAEKNEIKNSDELYYTLLNRGLLKSDFSVDLINHGEWVDSLDTVSGYPVYKSNASYHKSNAWDTAKITFSGYSNFRVFIRSYAESNYDYVLVSTLNNDYLATRNTTSAMRSAYNNTTYTKAYTRGKQSATNYEEVIFDNLDPTEEYYFYIIYQKDSSGDNNDDRGYFYIPMSKNPDGLDYPISQNKVIDMIIKNEI